MNVFKFWEFLKKIKSKIRDGQSKPLIKNQINEISKYYKALGVKNVKPYWHQYFSGINGNYSKKYIPQDYFFSTISYALNQKAYRSLMDKNLLDRVFQNIKHPKTVLKRINGFYHHNNIVLNKSDALTICKSYSKLLIKPSIYSGGAKNIIVFSIENEKTDFKNFSLEELLDSFGHNFIIQEVVNQHKLLNESSLNTLRIILYMPDENVNILSAYIRIRSKQ